MVSAENGFQWENEDTPYEEKSLLIDSLPEGFKYRVKKQKIRLLSNGWLGLDDFFEKWFLTGYSATVGWVSMIFLADPLEISILMKWKKN